MILNSDFTIYWIFLFVRWYIEEKVDIIVFDCVKLKSLNEWKKEALR